MVSVKEGDGEGSSLKEWNTQREIPQETTILPTESAKSQEPNSKTPMVSFHEMQTYEQINV